MSKPAALVTAAQIGRLAGVTRATVSNWRRRHSDFPAPAGGSDGSPAYDLDAVKEWLAARGQLPAGSPSDDLRAALRATAPDSEPSSRLLPLVLAVHRLGDIESRALVDLPDDQLAQQACTVVQQHAADIPGAKQIRYHPSDAVLLRALLRCVRAAGALHAASVVAERDLEVGGFSGVYQTPLELADLMADLLTEPGAAPAISVFDPACGPGNLLAAAARKGAKSLFGQDALPRHTARATVRLAVEAADARIRIRAGDSLRADAFPDLTVPAVLCNPPYGDRGWGHDALAYDPRWAYGLPPKGESELAWVQHCLAHLDEGGRAVLLMPPGAAERSGGRRIRAELVRSGALRAVVALPPGTAPPLHVGLHLWLLQRPTGQIHAVREVLFVDAAVLDPARRAGPRPAQDWDTTRSIVLDAWHAFAANRDLPGAAHAVAVPDLLDESVDITPARHVRGAPISIRPDRQTAMVDGLQIQLRQAAARLVEVSADDAWSSAGATSRVWRSGTVADLSRGGALMVLRASAPTHRSRGSAVGGDVLSEPSAFIVQEGDVLLPEKLHSAFRAVRVATNTEVGRSVDSTVHLLRPDPERLDSWFLAGFLAAEDNLSAAVTGTSILRVDVRRLRVPLLPLGEQRRYGAAFQQLYTLRTAAVAARRLAEEITSACAIGFTSGALLPPETDGVPPVPRGDADPESWAGTAES